jgi:hypothetical protein
MGGSYSNSVYKLLCLVDMVTLAEESWEKDKGSKRLTKAIGGITFDA